MAAIDDITIQYEEDGQVLVEELEKVVLTKGLWNTVMFRYRELDRKTGEMGPPKVSLRRYRKKGEHLFKEDAVNITEKTAPTVVKTLREWFGI